MCSNLRICPSKTNCLFRTGVGLWMCILRRSRARWILCSWQDGTYYSLDWKEDDSYLECSSSAPSTALTAMKSVVTSVSAIADDVDSFLRHNQHQRPNSSHETATQLVERLRATLGNLVAAVRTHAMSYGTSPVSLLDAAASHVSTTVTALVGEVLVRRDDGRRNSNGGSWAQVEEDLNRAIAAPVSRLGGGGRAVSDRGSSVGSPQNAAIFDTPLQTASTNGIGSDDSAVVEGSDEGWEELKVRCVLVDFVRR